MTYFLLFPHVAAQQHPGSPHLGRGSLSLSPSLQRGVPSKGPARLTSSQEGAFGPRPGEGRQPWVQILALSLPVSGS